MTGCQWHNKTFVYVVCQGTFVYVVCQGTFHILSEFHKFLLTLQKKKFMCNYFEKQKHIEIQLAALISVSLSSCNYVCDKADRATMLYS
jgi:hypothetical protein